MRIPEIVVALQAAEQEYQADITASWNAALDEAITILLNVAESSPVIPVQKAANDALRQLRQRRRP